MPWHRLGGDVRMRLRRVPRLGLLLNLAARALLLYFGAEAIQATVSNPNDRRFAGKGIALRNALLVGAFSMLLPVLHYLGPKRRAFPWAADAVLISVPVADMAGNSLDLYNNYGWYDSVTHFYGTAAVAGLMDLAGNGRNVRPGPYRWLVAASATTFFHVLLEIQEYWTDVIFGTHNVEGLEDTESDLLFGMFGAITGATAAELLFWWGGHFGAEAARLGSTLEPMARQAERKLLPRRSGGRTPDAADTAPAEARADDRGQESAPGTA